ncbi:hypothetical protein C2G38_2210403 [Gigaspora rosea]|uniref:Uncharacterized protein n=1 Tax=Gigaspora rosea TaxID=44941 RepID=A0A397UF20_9GLOM|nr:hypothetical protein C2G38_2210403 [Gigaspora rosea]
MIANPSGNQSFRSYYQPLCWFTLALRANVFRFEKQTEKIDNSSDNIQTANKDDNKSQDFSQDFLNEIIKEMYNLYKEKRLKCIKLHAVLEILEQLLIKKKQDPLENQINSTVPMILGNCYHHNK